MCLIEFLKSTIKKNPNAISQLLKIHKIYKLHFHEYLYTKQIINYLDENLFKNKNSIEKLFDLYNNEIQLFTLSQRYYEFIFILKNYYGFFEFSSILPDSDEIKIDSNKIIELFHEIDDFLYLLYKFNNNNKNIDEKQQLSIFAEYSNSLFFIFGEKFFLILKFVLEIKNK